jgi:hypothetical protein
MAEIAWAWIQLKIFGKGALERVVAGHLVDVATLLWSRTQSRRCWWKICSSASR